MIEQIEQIEKEYLIKKDKALTSNYDLSVYIMFLGNIVPKLIEIAKHENEYAEMYRDLES